MDYLHQSRIDLNFKQIHTIQHFIVSLTDRILKLVATMNSNLIYLLNAMLSLLKQKTPHDKYI